MPKHSTPTQLRDFAARKLSAMEIREVDLHLATCAECSQVLTGIESLQGAAGMLRRVRRAGSHLSYEQFEALVDAKVAVDLVAQTHLSGCSACARELAAMRSYAPTLSARVERRDPASSLAARLGAWMGSPRALGASMAVMVVALAVSAVWQGGIGMLDGAAGEGAIRSAHVEGPAQKAIPRDVMDESVFDDLGSVSISAMAAYQVKDFAATAAILKPLADAGSSGAQTALGVLLAEGRGVEVDLKEAERLWLLAADKVSSAKYNLGVLRGRPRPNTR